MEKQQPPKLIMLLDKANVEPLIAEKLGGFAPAYQLHFFDSLQSIDAISLANGACLLIAFPICSERVCHEIEAFLESNSRIPVILMAEKIKTQQLSRLYNLGLEWQIALTALATTDLTVLIEQAIAKHLVFAQLSASNKNYQRYFDILKKNKIISIETPETDTRFLEMRDQQESDRKLIAQTRFLSIETALNVAIKNNEFYMAYQPIVELETQQICHLEALLRWESSLLKEAVAPSEFIDVAEKSGLIISVTAIVLDLVCRYLRHSLDEQREVLPVAINVSMINLLQKNFVEDLLTSIHNYRLKPSYLYIELTESALMKNVEAVEKTIFALRQSGFHLSIDDFGTGYSSLARLREIKFDSIKIDKTFIASMFTDMNSMRIVHAVLDLTNELGILAIAEGIETEAQFEFLKKWHCHYGQGYYFAKPLLEKDLAAVIDKFNGIERLNTKGLTGKIIRNVNEIWTLGHNISNQLAGLFGYAEIILENMQTVTDEHNVLLAIHTAIVNGFEKCSALSFSLQEVQKQAQEAPSINLMHKLNDIARENGKLIFRVIVQLDYSVMPLLNDKHANLSPENKQKLQRMLELMINLRVLGDNLTRFSVDWGSPHGMTGE